MRQFHGALDKLDISSLKQLTLAFDKLHVLRLDKFLPPGALEQEGLSKEVRVQLDVLSAKGILIDLPFRVNRDDLRSDPDDRIGIEILGEQPSSSNASEYWNIYQRASVHLGIAFLRVAAKGIEKKLPGTSVTPIYRTSLFPGTTPDRWGGSVHDVYSVAIERLPTPDETCAWEDILDFKSETHDKLWHFRRFLHDLATKKKSEAEIRDDIEWSLNEYTKAMKLHNLKSGNSFVEVYIVPAMEMIEDLAKFNWSKIAKGALSVKKRQIELMEAEVKALGREVAYIYDAQTRFANRV